MNKKELIAKTAEKSGEHKNANNLVFSKKETEIQIDSFIEVIKEAVKNGEKVTLPGLGAFDIKEVGEREYPAKPGSEERKTVPAHKQPVFKMSDAFKKSLR